MKRNLHRRRCTSPNLSSIALVSTLLLWYFGDLRNLDVGLSHVEAGALGCGSTSSAGYSRAHCRGGWATIYHSLSGCLSLTIWRPVRSWLLQQVSTPANVSALTDS